MSALGRYIVDTIVLEDRSPTRLGREHGVSRSWIYQLLARFTEGGYPALEPRSRRPHSCSHLSIKERAIARTALPDVKAGRYRASDGLLVFLDGLRLCRPLTQTDVPPTALEE